MSERILDRAGGVFTGFVRGVVRVSKLSADGISERIYILVYICVSLNLLGDDTGVGINTTIEFGGVFWDRGGIGNAYHSADIVISSGLATGFATV